MCRLVFVHRLQLNLPGRGINARSMLFGGVAYPLELGASMKIAGLFLCLDPGVADNLGPFDNIGFDDGREFLGRTANRVEA